MAASSPSVQRPQKHQVFLNFRGMDTGNSFTSFLYQALRRNAINAYMDKDEQRGRELDYLFKRIEQSRIALVIFSENYANSRWCLDELLKIKEQINEQKLVAIPIFYKVKAADVKYQKGTFAVPFQQPEETFFEHCYKIGDWKKALLYVASLFGYTLEKYPSEADLVDDIVNNVRKQLEKVSSEETERPGRDISPGEREDPAMPSCSISLPKREKPPRPGIKSRLKHLEEKLNFESSSSRIVGVVGMPGIGKTTLAIKFYKMWKHRFVASKLLPDIRKQSKENGLDWLLKELLGTLLVDDKLEIRSTDSADEFLKSRPLDTKVFVVLDDVSDKKQIEVLLGKCDWMREGSKIVITTRDKKLIKDLVHDTYEVPRLNDREALQLFSYHAFKDHICPEGNFVNLSRKFIDCAQGNPFAIQVLGGDLRLSEGPWESKLAMLEQSPNRQIQEIMTISYDELSKEHKDAFLDVACFFRSEDEPYVRSMLQPSDSESAEAATAISDLIDKFLITISDNRVEMHDLLYTMGKELGSQASVQELGRRCRLWNHRDIIRVLKNRLGTENVRGIFLDMSKVKKMSLSCKTFINMRNLRYLKFYNSHCSRECEADCKLYLPDELEFPSDEIRYLHWLKFPLKNFSSDFNPKNLVDLKLPYSEIQQLWGDDKDAGKLKWIDLNHSHNLRNLSGLLGAENLERLNLEGCTSLVELPPSMQNMNSLVFLNLRGCTSLRSLPRGMNLKSLKTLIASSCSNLQKFQMISENLEAIHLDGTAIEKLPSAIKNLQRLVLLNLKSCEKLTCLTKSLDKLKSLKELILSGCSMLRSFPEVKENMNCLEILLLDGTAIKEMPKILHFTNLKTFSFCGCKGQVCGSKRQGYVDMSFPPLSGFSHLRDLFLSDCGLCEWPCDINSLSSLQRLCLSRNDIESLQDSINQLYNLKCLDLKYCKKLKSIPMLPPNLQWLDAHGCDSLERVACPLALLTVSEQIHSTFIFTNCNKLDQIAQDNIMSYARKKCQLMANALKLYDGGFVSELLVDTSFLGCEVPSWFTYQTVGSILETHLPPHWCDSKFIGIGLCAVVSFQDHQDPTNPFSVKCTCELKNEDVFLTRFSYNVGGWAEAGNEPRHIDSDHVFLGYACCLHITKRREENQFFGRCAPTRASLKFYVTDDTSEIASCEVVRCGLSLLYAPDETDNISGGTNSDATPSCSDGFQDISGNKRSCPVDDAGNPDGKRTRRQRRK